MRSVRREIGVFTFALVLAVSSCQHTKDDETIRLPVSPFFATVVPGGIHEGRIYLAIPLLAPQDREAFFKKAVPGMDKWSHESPVDSRNEGYGGDIIPDRYLDLKYIEAGTVYKVGQSLRVRTTQGVIPVRIVKYEVHFSYAGGDSFLYAVAEPTNGTLPAGASEHVLASPELPDCGGSCALSRIKPDADKTQKVRALAVEKLGLVFPADIPQEERAETLLTYQGHFTRTDSIQYVAFFARHSRDAVDVGKWVTYVVDSDFSLISVLGRDSYLQVTPDGIADVNGDGLDEIWSHDAGFEGTAYSLWYLESRVPPVSFSRVEWPYYGL